MQSVSLLTGSGPIWTGVAVVGAGVAVAFFFGAAKWVRVVAEIILALALVNALYIENQMSTSATNYRKIRHGPDLRGSADW